MIIAKKGGSCIIESPYGEFRPRLINQSPIHNIKENMLVSNRDRDGYKDVKKFLWKIVRSDDLFIY